MFKIPRGSMGKNTLWLALILTVLFTSVGLAGQIMFTFTAVHEDQGFPNSGNCEYYEFRYHTDSITDENWNNALIVNDSVANHPLLPAEPGETERISLPCPDGGWWYSVKVFDRQNNGSGVSNSVFITSDSVGITEVNLTWK